MDRVPKEHNFIKKLLLHPMLETLRQGVQHVHIRHDDWCDFFCAAAARAIVILRARTLVYGFPAKPEAIKINPHGGLDRGKPIIALGTIQL